QDVRDLLEEALVPPGVEVVADELPGGEVVGQHAPGTAGAGQVKGSVDDLPAGVGAVPPWPARGLPLRREQVFDVVPLDVGQVAGVALASTHTSSVGEAPAAGEGQFLDGQSGR